MKLVCQQTGSGKDRVECVAACYLCFLFPLVLALFFFFSVCCLDLWGMKGGLFRFLFCCFPWMTMLSTYVKCRWVARIAWCLSYFPGVDEWEKRDFFFLTEEKITPISSKLFCPKLLLALSLLGIIHLSISELLSVFSQKWAFFSLLVFQWLTQRQKEGEYICV